MKRLRTVNWFSILCILVTAVLIVLLCYSDKVRLCAKEKEQEKKCAIHFVAYSDFHGRVEETDKNPGMEKFVTAIQEYSKIRKKDEECYILSSGDNFQGTPISIASNGKIVTDIMKYMKVSYSAVGNHEFDWGENLFTNWTRESGTTFLSANIVDRRSGGKIKGIEPYDIIESNGKKIGIIGLTTKETVYKTLKTNLQSYYFLDAKETVCYYTKMLRKKKGVDAVIVLAHLGGKQDKSGIITGEIADIANSGADIDAIIGGHMHTTIHGKVNGIPIIEPASNGRVLGLITMEFNKDKVKTSCKLDILSKRKKTIEANKEAIKIKQYYNQKYGNILNEELTILQNKYKHDKKSTQTDMGRFVARILAEKCNAEIGIINSSGIRRGLNTGIVHTKDIYLMFPHNVTLCTVELTGREIMGIIEYGISNQKGKSGINYYGVQYNRMRECGKVTMLYSMKLLNGQSIDMDKRYRVATTSYMVLGGDGYSGLKNSSTYNTKINLRDVVIDGLKEL